MKKVKTHKKTKVKTLNANTSGLLGLTLCVCVCVCVCVYTHMYILWRERGKNGLFEQILEVVILSIGYDCQLQLLKLNI